MATQTTTFDYLGASNTFNYGNRSNDLVMDLRYGWLDGENTPGVAVIYNLN